MQDIVVFFQTDLPVEVNPGQTWIRIRFGNRNPFVK